MSDRSDLHEMISENGGHPILMDALSATLLRYMTEHPHLTVCDLRKTVAWFDRMIEAMARAEEEDEIPEMGDDV